MTNNPINLTTGQHFPTVQFARKEHPEGPIFFPLNEAARNFTRISGGDAIPFASLKHIRELGFRIEVSEPREPTRQTVTDPKFAGGDDLLEPGCGRENPYKRPRMARPVVVDEDA